MIHLVWATKNRFPFLTDNIRSNVFDHIRYNAKNKGIYLDRINGYVEHVHCTVPLSSGQTVDKVVQLLKGESSFWINQEKFLHEKFEWQDEYFAESVSPGALPALQAYIDNQEIHHKTRTFGQEYKDLLVRNGFNPTAAGKIF